MFYLILHAHFYGVAKYCNLQFLAKISSKIAFYIAIGHYIIVVYIFTMEICNKKFLINSKWFSLQNCGCARALGRYLLRKIVGTQIFYFTLLQGKRLYVLTRFLRHAFLQIDTKAEYTQSILMDES